MSLHLIKSNSVFFQIPKTGGTWAWKALENAGVKFTNDGGHNTYTTESTKYRKSFAFVRKPFDFYRSYWCYRTENKLTKWYLEQYCWADNFEEFIQNVVKSRYPYVTELYRTYIGQPQVVDYIGRQENLTEDLIAILKMLDEDFDEKKLRETPKDNVSKTRPNCHIYLELAIDLLEQDVLNKYYYGSEGIIKK